MFLLSLNLSKNNLTHYKYKAMLINITTRAKRGASIKYEVAESRRALIKEAEFSHFPLPYELPYHCSKYRYFKDVHNGIYERVARVYNYD